MEGIGSVITSSPSSPVTGRPAGSYASTFAPRQRQVISPRHTGSSGTPPRKPVHRSVPPESDISGTGGGYLLGHPVEALPRQRRAGGADPPQAQAGREVTQGQAGFAAGHEIRGRGAEVGHTGLFGQPPQGAEVGV